MAARAARADLRRPEARARVPRGAARGARAVHVRGSPPRDAQPAAGLPRRAARVRGALHAPPRRRVPGHRPAAGRDPPVPHGVGHSGEGRRPASSRSRAPSSWSATRSSPSTASGAPTSRRTSTSGGRSRRPAAASSRSPRTSAPSRPSPRPRTSSSAGSSRPSPTSGRPPSRRSIPCERTRARGGRFPAALDAGTQPGGRLALRAMGGRLRMARRVGRPRTGRAVRGLPRPDAHARPHRRVCASARGVRRPGGRLGEPLAPDLARPAGAPALPRGDPGPGRRRLRRRVPLRPSLRQWTTTPSTRGGAPAAASPTSRTRRRAGTRASCAGCASSPTRGSDVRAHGAGAAIGLIVERLGAVARLAAGPEGSTASGNLLKVLALARRLSGNGLAFRDIVERLAEDAPALDLEEMSVAPVERERRPPHEPSPGEGARGPHRRPRRARRGEKARSAEARLARTRRLEGLVHRGVHVACRRARAQWNVTAVPPDWENRRKIEIAFEEAERQRLLYVASTRARDTLVVSLLEDKPEKGAWAPLRTVLRDLPTAAATYEPAEPASAAALGARLRDARRAIAIAREAATTPTQAVVSVTALSQKEGPRAPSPAEEARGAAWGRVLHRLLESAMRSPGSRPQAARREPPAGGGGRAEPPRERPERGGFRHDVRPVGPRVESLAAVRRGAVRDGRAVDGPRALGRPRRDAPQGSDGPRLRGGRRLAHRGLEVRRRGRPPSRARRALRAAGRALPARMGGAHGPDGEGRALLHGHRGSRLAGRRRKEREERRSL